MDRDCPAYLSVGTDVSAKYRGAFCEAKVKTTTKHVKCKINFKGLSSAIVSDEFVNGILKVGAAVNARHPEQGTYLDGVITKLTDASTYTVVFDDGDEKTLRRSSLCLQGERHFNESETLDHLPLTDPENFGTPVVRDAKKRKKRKPIESDEEQTPSSASPSASRKRTGNSKGYEDVGKVVIVELNEKKKNSWFPALVVHPKRAKEVSSKNKDNLILKSFKDNKIHNIAKNSTKSFTTKDHVYKGDNNSLKAAVGKAVSYIETGNLPTNWDSGIITEEDFLFESDDEVDSDEESDEDFDVETDAWLASLYKFMEERGTPINKPPVLGYQDLNLFKLFKLVQGLGGCRKVTDHQKWREISFKMGIPVINSSSHHNIKASYTKYLHAFEEYNRKLGPGLPGPLTRTTRRRSSFERPTLSPIRPRATRTPDEDGESDNEREPPMLKRRVTITEIEEEVDEKPVKKSERQNKKDDKQKTKDVKKEESDKEDDTEDKNAKSKASEQKAESKTKNKDTVKVDNKEKPCTEEVDETDETQSQETDTDYQLGEKIKVLYGRGRTQKVYEAKIIEIDVEAHWNRMYRVHYVGWNIRHDEWIGNNRIVGSEDRVKLRKKQKQDKEKEREKKLKEKEKKDKEEKERLQREEKERIQKEHEKLLKDKKEKERQEKEKERLEKERIKKEKEKLEKEKKEKHEKEIREKERLEREREKQEKERKRKEKAEQEKKAKEEERRLKELEIAESLENKKKEKKDEKGKGKGKPRSKEEPETLNTDKAEKEDQAEVERPKTPGKRGRPSLKSNTTPTARSNSVTRKVPSPISSKSKSTRTRRSDRNSLSESPFAAGLDVKPRTRKSSIHSDTKLKQDDDSESETSNSIKDEEEKAEEIKDAEEEQEETPVKENEDIKIQVVEKEDENDENDDEKEEENEMEDEKQVEEEPIKENDEIKEEIVPVEIPVAGKEVVMEQKHVEELVEIMMPKGKEKKKEKKEGKSKKRKEGKIKKDKKDDIIEQSEESFTSSAPVESNSCYQDSVENVKNEEEKTVVNKKENEEERPKKDNKSEGKKSRKRRRSKSLSERKAKETADIDNNKDREEDIEFKRLSFSRFKEEEGAAALMDIYNPSGAVHEKLESMAQTSKSLTPPTTPENSPPNPCSPADQSIDLEMGMHDEPSNRSDSDGMIDVADVTDVQPMGNQSPHCDASVSSNTSADSVNCHEKRSGSSKKRRRTISEGDTPSKRKRRSHKHSSHHEKKKRHSKEPVRHSSSDTDDTSNNDMKTTTENLLVPKTPEQNGKHIHRSGRTPKYNFRVDLTNIHDPEERISIIQNQLNEMRKIYMSLKNEVASIDRRRKKLRRKEREGKAAAALTISSDRRTSDRHSNDTS